MIGALAFVVGGAWGVLDAERLASSRYPKVVVLISGLAALVFFGLCFVFIAKKVFSNKPGLIINAHGITDHSSATSVGLIEWRDIIGIETIQIEMPYYVALPRIKSPKMLIIKISSPQKYIKRSKNRISRQAMQVNNRRYGSPIAILSNTLNIKFSDLETAIAEALKQQNT